MFAELRQLLLAAGMDDLAAQVGALSPQTILDEVGRRGAWTAELEEWWREWTEDFQL